MDFTHDPARRSFVDVPAGHDFPIQNLPFGIFAHGVRVRAGTAIGGFVLDLAGAAEAGLLDDVPHAAEDFGQPALNSFMARGRDAWRAARHAISRLLDAENPRLRDDAGLRGRLLLPAAACEMRLPARIGDYTDFYSSREHATNVGIMFRGPENALMPNWLHVPIGYHGRASSIVPSGTPIRRPRGQTKADDAPAPSFGPSRSMDFELELGYFVGPGNALGEPIPIADAGRHLFGVVLVNDWSARDIQKWEYQPLGPFLGKNLGTSISPWVVTMEALEPFRCEGPAQDPAPLPYLAQGGPQAFDIELEVLIQTAKGAGPHRVSRTNFRTMYWSMVQQLAHHASNGCNLQPGDLLASGTISGAAPDSFGSMLELAWKGTKPVAVGEETRTFLQDGDTVVMRGWSGKGGLRIGLGECRGQLLPALSQA